MINKGLLLEKKFYIEIRGTALKNAYHIVGDSIKIMPTLFCDHSIKMMPTISRGHSIKMMPTISRGHSIKKMPTIS
ncbi:hypothetical protein F7198_06355 [Helicobacter pylori]|nr:hypothetical protein [Helicobacter pylori]